MDSSKLLNVNFRHLIGLLRNNSTLVDVKHIPFNIPKPIQRSSTDLLKALAGTVKEDETASHFSLVDDPIMIPTSSKDKKLHLMSKELGRRTARKLVEEWPTLFMFDRDTPELKAFRPQKPLDPALVEPNEENLHKMIIDRRVSDAVQLYQKIVEAKIDISDATKLDFFRLVCYYNQNDFPLTEFEEWHAIRFFYSNKENNETTWTKGGIAENFFSELPKTEESYSTLICALCKFPGKYSRARARELYTDMLSAGLTPFEDVFNSLISARVPFDNSFTSNATHWLREMSRLGVRPSVKTFNAALYSLQFDDHIRIKQYSNENGEDLSCEEGDRMVTATLDGKPNGPEADNVFNKELRWKIASDLMIEMRLHGLEPTLTTFFLALNLEPSTVIVAGFIDEVLTWLEMRLSHSKPIERSGDDDALFFRNTMTLTCTLNNESQVDRLIKIYRSEQNNVFFECQDDETRFYGDFLRFKLAALPLDAFYVIYKIYVPRLLGVTAKMISEIMRTINMRKPEEFCWPLLKRVAEDVISSNMITHDRIAFHLLTQLTDVKPRLFNLPDWEVYMELCRKVIDIVERLDRQKIEREMNKDKH